MKCSNCECRIKHEYLVILGEIQCPDCAAEWMEDELDELKWHNKHEYLERASEALGYQILEV